MHMSLTNIRKNMKKRHTKWYGSSSLFAISAFIGLLAVLMFRVVYYFLQRMPIEDWCWTLFKTLESCKKDYTCTGTFSLSTLSVFSETALTSSTGFSDAIQTQRKCMYPTKMMMMKENSAQIQIQTKDRSFSLKEPPIWS